MNGVSLRLEVFMQRARSWSLSSGVVALALAGCAEPAAPAPDTQASEIQADDGLRAELRNVRRDIDRAQCTIKVAALDVGLPDAAAAAAINARLAIDWTSLLDEAWCDDHYLRVDQRTTPDFNERGWLTIRFVIASDIQDLQPTKAIGFRNFDLRTGAFEPLDAVLDEVGMAIAVRACKTLAVETGEPELESYCDDVGDATFDGSSAFAIESGGLRIHPLNTPAELFDAASRGVLIPWSTLRGHVMHPTLAAIAR
jgi:hypothetical protein